MALGRPAWKEARSSLQRILSASEGVLRDNQDLQKQVLLPKSHINII
jgi:fumarylacetoacetase